MCQLCIFKYESDINIELNMTTFIYNYVIKKEK